MKVRAQTRNMIEKVAELDGMEAEVISAPKDEKTQMLLLILGFLPHEHFKGAWVRYLPKT